LISDSDARNWWYFLAAVVGGADQAKGAGKQCSPGSAVTARGGHGSGSQRTKLLDELLVLVEVLQPVRVLEVEAERGGLFAVEGVAQHADLHLWSRDVWQLDVAGETLVLLRVVVLQANLQLNRLEKAALLLLRPLQHLVDAQADVVVGDLGHGALP
jgi:hypothetical protein